ncbi:hypothetical protein M440DRAFT_1034401 [Trichoderma longibrachiatum ATCC 18648]|uniref:Uncharacterized protein n=1 Tax=Trichoderma longibrachiatum ATCC 18648 TaxID=983965 RepID=A0A2T4BZK2_TRILO|nr:hypothetical protein M440DRAFT_1034401 [Trichoderma longibrachiatum ATCC 18648]
MHTLPPSMHKARNYLRTACRSPLKITRKKKSKIQSSCFFSSFFFLSFSLFTPLCSTNRHSKLTHGDALFLRKRASRNLKSFGRKSPDVSF